LISSISAPYWYGGYFRYDLSQKEIEGTLKDFDTKTIIVGHTIQPEVNKRYNGKVIGIDVKHPQDQYKYFPKIESEGLLIESGKYYRVFENGDIKGVCKLNSVHCFNSFGASPKGIGV
jgi:hypothetical protein